MLQYITLSTTWENLSVGDNITFHIPDGSSYEYFIIKMGQSRYFCEIRDATNRTIFNILEIDAEKFVANIVDYICVGEWPEVKTLNDLKKVIKALDDECIKKFGNLNASKFKVGDKVRILPRKGEPMDYIGVYIDGMLKFSGEIGTISKIYPDSGIALNEIPWKWDPKALELVEEKIDKPKTQTETELNLFPAKKHYQLNFNY